MFYLISLIIFLANTFTILNIILIAKYLFGCDMTLDRKTLLITGSLFFVLNIAISLLLSDRFPNLTFVLLYAYIVIVVLVLTKTHRMKAALLTIPALLVYIQWTSLASLIEILFRLDRFYFPYPTRNITVTDILLEPLLFILLMLIASYGEKHAFYIQLTLGEGIIISLLCFFLPMAQEIFMVLEDYFDNVLYNFAWILFLLALNFAMIYAIAHRKRAQYYKVLSENYKEQFDSEYHYFKDYQEEQHDLAKFRHDFNSHMMLLQEMIAKGDYRNAENYFSALTESFPAGAKTILTGNNLIDLLLNARADLFRSEKIDLRCASPLSGLEFMNEVDCCILFSNLIDNAIEANRKLESNRYIEFICRQSEQTLYLEICNPLKEKPVLQDNRYLSAKPGGYHGIGLQNVMEIINKYHGTHRIEDQNNIFSVQILFPLPLIG